MISIIIPAYNEENYIKRTLESIKQQPYKDYEIIVVLDSCKDNTDKIAKTFTKKVYKINKMNVSAAENLGAKKAKGDILIFLDADSTISKNLLFEVEKACKKHIGGTTKTISLENKLKAHLIWAIGNLGRNFFMAASGFKFCKKQAFPEFPENIHIAEDTFFMKRLKKKGKLKYIRNAYIKTSARRFEKQGYIKTIYAQFKGFFIKTSKRQKPLK
jgi:glycosyltransferase involved in cell wall biosynthesis